MTDHTNDDKKTKSILSEKEIEDFLSKLVGIAPNAVVKASAMVDHIFSFPEEKQNALMELLITKYIDPNLSSITQVTGEDIPSDEVKSLAQTLGTMITGSIQVVVKTRMPVKEAAIYLRDLIARFTNKKQQIVAMVLIMQDDALPYVQVPMSDYVNYPDEKFDAKIKANFHSISKIKCSQRAATSGTEEADLIWKTLNEIQDEEDRIVVFAHMLLTVRRELMESRMKSLRG